jgi:hypothetical protein
MLLILNQDIKPSNLVNNKLKYEIKNELPSPDMWFKCFTGIDSLEEAQRIKAATEGKVTPELCMALNSVC